jgi:hypothetical protein
MIQSDGERRSEEVGELRLGFIFTHLGVRYIVQGFSTIWNMDGRTIQVTGWEEDMLIKKRMELEAEQRMKDEALSLMRKGNAEFKSDEDDAEDDETP